ncbi:MAG: hypothetical protein IPH13_01065 [Planctomycetes bacterium]|nr:hypothetical protein [Planctomycetota bacterium]MCC7170549.1 hypothetical protein [Planctomycetota bacterium]
MMRRLLVSLALTLLPTIVPAAQGGEFRPGRPFVLAYDLDTGLVCVAELTETGALARCFGSGFAMDVASALQFMPDGSLIVLCGPYNLGYIFNAAGTLTGTMTLTAGSSGGSTISNRGWLYYTEPGVDAVVERRYSITNKTSVGVYGGDVPLDLEVDSLDRLVFSSFGTDRIIRFDATTGIAETLGDDTTTGDVTRLAVTWDDDIFALRSGSNSIALIRDDGVTTDVVDVAAVTPTDIAIAADGTVAVLSRDTHEIIHVDPASKSVVRRVEYPANLYALHLAYAPSYFDAKVKSVMLPDDETLAPITTTIKGARFAMDSGRGCVTLTIPPTYVSADQVPSFFSSPVTLRLQPGFTSGKPLPTSGFGTSGGGYFSMATEVTSKAGKPGNPQLTRLKGSLDFFGIDAAHLEFTTTKRRK